MELIELLQQPGLPAEVDQAYRQIIPVLEKLIALCPNEPAYESDLGAKLNDLAVLLIDSKKDLAERRQLLEQAVTHQQAALQRRPADVTYRRFLGHHYLSLGNALTELEKYVEKSYHLCLEVREKLAADYPAEPAYQADVAVAKRAALEVRRLSEKAGGIKHLKKLVDVLAE